MADDIRRYILHFLPLVRIGLVAGGVRMKKVPIFYNALMLTGVNLLLRFVGTSFQVFISGRIGAAGVGLLQLVLSVGSMAMTAGMAGVRTACMYLSAEELGKKQAQNVTWVLSGCILYSLLCGGTVGGLVYGFAPKIAALWIGDSRTVGAIRLFAAFLPISCMSGVMVGYFTAANRIATLAAVEVAEQLCSMAVTACALVFWAGGEIGRACQAVVLGGCVGSLLTLSCLVVLRVREQADTGRRIPIARRLAGIALPLAAADDLKVGINTVENLMVPKRLMLYTSDALAQFGVVSGMVFPVIMFPAAILYALADLLIPEMARCSAAGSRARIRYLARRSLRIAMVYGVVCGGILYLLAERIGMGLYRNGAAGEQMAVYALLVPMLYCDAIIDAINKGLGQQKICVRFNILTALMDVVGLYLLLPVWGMRGYFISFLVSHAVNAALSLGLLLKTADIRVRLRIPLATVCVMAGAIWMAGKMQLEALRAAAFAVLALLGLYAMGVVRKEDGVWLVSLIKNGKKPEKMKNNV